MPAGLPPEPPSTPWTRFGLAVVEHPRLVVAVALVLAALSGTLAATALRVRPGYVDLLDRRSPLQARYLDLIENFGNIETLYVLVSGPDEAGTGRFIDRLADLVRQARDESGAPIAGAVLERVDPEWFLERLPAWLPDAVIEDLADGAFGADLPNLLADPTPARALDAIRGAVDRAVLRAADPGRASPALPDHARVAAFLDEMAHAARGESFDVAAMLRQPTADAAGRIDAAGHVRAGPRRFVVTIAPADTSNNYRIMEPFLAAVKSAARQAQEETGADVSLSHAGAPALIVDEMRAVSHDVTLASLLSVVLVTLLFFVSFNSLRHVLFAGIANVAGLALTFGAAYVLVGYLNLFSAVFAAVLAGLGIDFGIHVINHYEARRRDEMAARDALVDVFRSVVPAIATSAITTAAAFLAIVTSEFDGFAQLGLISGVGVLLCVAMSITLIPALLAIESRRGVRPRAATPWSQAGLLAIQRHATPIAAAGLVVAALAALGLPRLRFDHDLMNLQPAGSEAVDLQRREENRVSTHLAFSLARTREEAARRAERFAGLPSVASAKSIASFLPPDGPARQGLLARLAARVGAPATGAGPAVDMAATLAACDTLVARLQALEDLAFEGRDEAGLAALDGMLRPARELRDAVARGATAAPGLTAFRDQLATRLRGMALRLPELAARPLEPRDLPPALASHFVGKDGSLAVIVEPRESVWDRAALERFAAEIRTVDPEVTGPSIQVLEVTELMRRSLVRAALVALAVIVLLTLASMRSAFGTFLALLPLLLGFVLMLGTMAWTDVPLNPANLVALPLLLGIGVDGGVHVAHRWLENRDARRTVEEVGHPLLITSLTTLAGFLPLLLARHQGIRSLGVLTCIGSVTMLLAAVVLMPAMLGVLDRSRLALSRAHDGGDGRA